MFIISLSEGQESQSSPDECLWLVPLDQGTHMAGTTVSGRQAQSRQAHLGEICLRAASHPPWLLTRDISSSPKESLSSPRSPHFCHGLVFKSHSVQPTWGGIPQGCEYWEAGDKETIRRCCYSSRCLQAPYFIEA